MYSVELYSRVRRACHVGGMTERAAAAASCARIWSRQIRWNARNEGRAIHKAVAGMAQVICSRKRPRGSRRGSQSVQ